MHTWIGTGLHVDELCGVQRILNKLNNIILITQQMLTLYSVNASGESNIIMKHVFIEWINYTFIIYVCVLLVKSKYVN